MIGQLAFSRETRERERESSQGETCSADMDIDIDVDIWIDIESKLRGDSPSCWPRSIDRAN